MRLLLHHLSGSREGDVTPFDQDVVKVGRDPSNHLVFHPEKDILCSAFHAEIRRQGDKAAIRDLNSRNGTYVNGEAVTEAELRDGDRVAFGYGGPEVRVKIEVDRPLRTTPPASPPPKRPPGLLIGFHHLDGSRKGRDDVFRGTVVTVGRNPAKDLRFDPEKDLSVSWNHGRFVAINDEWWYEDLNSRNGTYVNNARQARCRIQADDVVRFGHEGPSVRVRLAAREADTPGVTVELGVATDASGDATPATEVSLVSLAPGGEVTIGRAAEQGLCLPHPGVSRLHARVRRVHADFVVEDCRSMNGTFVNGERLAGPRRLVPGDRIYIGVCVISFTGDRLATVDQEGAIRVTAEGAGLHVWTRDPQTGRRASRGLLDRVSLVVRPREFVAILGPAGSGKSTLMNVLSGRRRPTAGAIYYNDDDFFRYFGFYRTTIGYVPQHDIVHEQLTVGEALLYAARLRLPADLPGAEMEGRVEEVLEQVDLVGHRGNVIRLLSGGEQRRVNLAVELVSEPKVLFLDEATSGLDAGTDLDMMTLFRRVANQGRTVVCVTHNVEYVADQCDLVILVCGGKLVFYGPPKDMLQHFHVERICRVYRRLEERPADYWVKAYEDSPWHQDYVAKRLASQSVRREAQEARDRPRPARVAARRTASTRQFGTLTRRFLAVLRRDRRNVALLLAQAPVIALIVGLVMLTPGDKSLAMQAAHHAKVSFILVLAAAWFGCFNASREIVKERAIFERESAVNLSIPAYVLSKAIPLLALCAAQCLILWLIVRPMTRLPGDPAAQVLALFATSASAMLLGLLISALASTEDLAVRMVPYVLIPQVVLSDAIVQLKGPPLVGARLAVLTYWAYDAMKVTIGEAVVRAQGQNMPLRYVATPSPDGGVAPVLGRLGDFQQDLLVLGVFSLLFLLLSLVHLSWRPRQA